MYFDSDIELQMITVLSSDMVSCEQLINIDAYVASTVLDSFDRKPEQMLPCSNFESLVEIAETNNSLLKIMLSFVRLYGIADTSGFQICPDRFGGFGLFNRKTLLKPKIDPLPNVVGVLENIPDELRDKLKALSIMKSSFTNKDVVLLGVVRFVNHSCRPNTLFFQGYSFEGLKYRTVRFQVIRPIKVIEEITVDYGDSYFTGMKECMCEKCLAVSLEPSASNAEPPLTESQNSTEPEELLQTVSASETKQEQSIEADQSDQAPELVASSSKGLRSSFPEREHSSQKFRQKRRYTQVTLLENETSHLLDSFIHQVSSKMRFGCAGGIDIGDSEASENEIGDCHANELDDPISDKETERVLENVENSESDELSDIDSSGDDKEH